MQHTNTRIYERSLELLRVTHATTSNLPVGYGYLADQLRRATASILLNFSEGCGKPGTAERRRYFMTARGSAYEVAAVYDILHAFALCDSATREHVLDLSDHLAGMLTRFADYPSRNR